MFFEWVYTWLIINQMSIRSKQPFYKWDLGGLPQKSKSKSWAFDNRHQWIDGKVMYVMFSWAKKKKKTHVVFLPFS